MKAKSGPSSIQLTLAAATSLPGPLRQHAQDVGANQLAGTEPVAALHEQRIVRGMLVANPGDDGQVDGFWFQGASRGGAADAASGGVMGDDRKGIGSFRVPARPLADATPPLARCSTETHELHM